MMRCKERLEAYLREQQVAFTTQHHRPAYTAQAVAAIEHIPGKLVAKVVVVFADDALVMLVMPASYQVDLTRVGAAIGARSVYFAGEGELAAIFPDCELGAMPPFGNLYDLPVYVDRMLAEDETIVIQAGTHTRDRYIQTLPDSCRSRQPMRVPGVSMRSGSSIRTEQEHRSTSTRWTFGGH